MNNGQMEMALEERQETEEQDRQAVAEQEQAHAEDTQFADAVAGIRDNWLAFMAGIAELYPQTNLRASGFHPCDRNLYYQVHNWKDQALPTAEQQCLFEFGKFLETYAIPQLRRVGYRIVDKPVEGDQFAFEQPVKGGIITGRIDGWISEGPKDTGFPPLSDIPQPFELKGYTWDAGRFDHWREMLDAPQPWIRSVPCQMQMYLLLTGRPEGVLCLFDKKGAQPYPLPVELDLDFAEGLLQRAEDIYEHLEMELEPDRISYESAVCGSCPFAHICQPLESVEVAAGGEVFDETQEEHMRVLFDTEEAAKAHATAEKAVKAFGKGLGDGQYLIGPGQVTVKTSSRHYKAAPAKEASDVPTTTVKIKPREV